MAKKLKVDFIEMLEGDWEIGCDELDAFCELGVRAIRLCGQIATCEQPAILDFRRNDPMMAAFCDYADLIYSQATGKEAVELE